MRKIKNEKGFTLIEILVVIGIIAILAAIVLVAINPARQFAQANNTQRTSNVNAILNAVGQYMVDNNGSIPTAITTSNQSVSDAGADICGDLVPTYMPALPVDPTATTTTATDDGQVSSSECSGTYDTGYKILKDSDGRITVSAPNTDLSVASTTISVTR